MGFLVGLAAVVAASSATAGAWVQPRGGGQVILKYEDLRADAFFDEDGRRIDLPGTRRDGALGVFAEYGLTDRLTLQLKGDLQDGKDGGLDYRGRGPLEIGATWQAWRDDRGAVSVYGGYARAGDGRNAGYSAPGIGEQDWEVRGSAGRSFGGVGPARFGPDQSFVEVQAARRFREGLADETRADVTVGGHFGANWMVLGQAFGGVTDDDGARWLSLETSIVRHQGDWSLQAGWRHAVAGRRTPETRGLVLAIWRRF